MSFRTSYSIQCDFCSRRAEGHYMTKVIATEHTFTAYSMWKLINGRHWCGRCELNKNVN